MEKHRCKLCARTFSNGRALGGHMKGHLANHPLPPKTTPHHQLSNRTDSASSSSSSSGEDQEKSRETLLDDKSLAYGLRENPKKSFRFADPEFSFAPDSGSVVQDRESETESRNPTRRRSKRKPRVGTANNATTDGIKKPKLSSLPSLIDSPPPNEPEPVSSVSNTSPEEDVAMCLMLLSRDAWNVELKSQKSVESLEESEEIELSNNQKKSNEKHRCVKCKKAFGSYDTFDEHKRVCSETKKTGKVAAASAAAAIDNDSKRFECPFCCRVFGSGQALGGHKRSHLLASASSSNAAAKSSKFDNNLIDLNTPAPLEDDEFSVVSDA